MCTPVQDKQVILSFLAYSALWASKCTPVHYGQAGVQQCTYVNFWMEMKNSMLCSSPDDALSVLRSGVLQMAMAIHLSIAISNQIERFKWLVCILIIFLISHCISISVGRGVASGQGWNILVKYLMYLHLHLPIAAIAIAIEHILEENHLWVFCAFSGHYLLGWSHAVSQKYLQHPQRKWEALYLQHHLT